MMRDYFKLQDDLSFEVDAVMILAHMAAHETVRSHLDFSLVRLLRRE